jgi:hypothetical protein
VSASAFFRSTCLIATAIASMMSAPADAQLGPIEPIIIANAKPGQALANIPDTKQDYVVPFEATIAADGSVKEVTITTPTGDEKVNQNVVRFVMEKRFLPAVDAAGLPAEAKLTGTVDFRSKSINKQLKISIKPPNTRKEVARVRKLTCKDFLWELDRLRGEGASADVSREIMPWVSLRIAMLDKKIPAEREPAILPKWPGVLADAEKVCRAAPAKLYINEVLIPLLEPALG